MVAGHVTGVRGPGDVKPITVPVPAIKYKSGVPPPSGMLRGGLVFVEVHFFCGFFDAARPAAWFGPRLHLGPLPAI